MALVHVVLVQTSLGTRTIVPVGLIDVALLGPNPERCRFVIREVQCRDRDFARLIMASVDELERFLSLLAISRTSRGCILRSTDLRLSEHVDKPTAHSPICTARDQVVRVLRTDHLHRVYRMCVAGSRQRRL